ncbi:alternate-type signal peptide domain-containing protein [Microbacterium sp.]|uniref:alternate-type signal peptide domain-containing protein n=1 Tax=Microbacterium sp. TaxID=51671 RepID=UPI0039E36945
MNKITKGTIAAGAAVLLLLGAGGSLAYWNDEADIAGHSIQTGVLQLEADASAGVWSPALSLWVPGDHSTYTANLVLTATGDNMQGTIALDEDSIVVPDQFEVTIGHGTLPSGVTFDAATNAFTFDGTFAAATIPVTVTVAFPYLETAAQNDSQDIEVDLSGIAFVATQTAASGAVTTP